MKHLFTALFLVATLLVTACSTDESKPADTPAPAMENKAAATTTIEPAPGTDERSVAEQLAENNQKGVYLGKLVLKNDLATVEKNIRRDKIDSYAEDLRKAVEAALADETEVQGRLTIDCVLRPGSTADLFLNYVGMTESALKKADAALRKVPQLSTQQNQITFQIELNVSLP